MFHLCGNVLQYGPKPDDQRIGVEGCGAPTIGLTE